MNRDEARDVLARWSGNAREDLHYAVMEAAAYRRARRLAEERNRTDAAAQIEQAWTVLRGDG